MSPGDCPIIEEAIRHLEAHPREQPGLAELAERCGLSRTHLQRVFERWAGVGPERFIQLLTPQYARERLRESRAPGASYNAALSDPSRLHDPFVNVEAVTPGELERRGEGPQICWGVHPSVFGECLIGTTSRGICWLAFVGEKDAATAEFRRFAWWKLLSAAAGASLALQLRAVFTAVAAPPTAKAVLAHPKQQEQQAIDVVCSVA